MKLSSWRRNMKVSFVAGDCGPPGHRRGSGSSTWYQPRSGTPALERPDHQPAVLGESQGRKSKAS